MNRAALLAADVPDRGWSPEESLEELAGLATAAGIEVAARVIQRLRDPQPLSYLGKGKLQELRKQKSTLRLDTVIADDELSPAQQRHLEQVLDVQVLDRTAVILHIFAQHARSREGRLQVELAQYKYRLPRLTGRGTELSRLGAGINTRGPGETKLESDRRRIRRRISQLEEEIDRVRRQRTLHREQRRVSGLPVVALVGYTNAGKSTLTNALTGAEVYSSEQLFATLDPTTRRLVLPNAHEILITDTVGFIQKLPTDLVTAFRATLEEISEADLLLHVIDASHPQVEEQVEAVEDELEGLGVEKRPRINVLNKVDLLAEEQLRSVRRLLPDSVIVSARRRQGIPDLLTRLEEQIAASFVPVRVLIPYDHAEMVSLFRSRGMVELEEHQALGTTITGKLPPALASSFRAFLA